MLNKRISRFFLGGFFFSHLLSAVYPSHSFCTKGLCSELKRIYSLQEEGDSEVEILKDHKQNYPMSISNGSYRPMSPTVVPAYYVNPYFENQRLPIPAYSRFSGYNRPSTQVVAASSVDNDSPLKENGKPIAYPINDYRYDDMGRKYYDYQQKDPYNASRIYLNDIVTYYSGVFKKILRR